MAWTLAIPAVMVCWAQTAAAQGEIVPDANTVVLDHFNGATAGTAVGTLGFATSLSGLGQAGVFAAGNYVRYSFAGFGQGTVEMWLRPSSLSGWTGLLNFNWGLSASYPPAGHVLHLGISTAIGEVQGGFWPSGGATNSAAVPVGQWTHVALSWGPAGTKLYVDGTPAVGTPGGPSMLSTNYAYLNYWATLDVNGVTPFDGLIDEFHISKVQRSDAEIAQHATLTTAVNIDIKPGSDPNCFNLNGNGVIPVAILGSASFDVSDIDVGTLLFDGLQVRVRGNKGPQCATEDSNGDSFPDLVCHFQDDPDSWTAGNTVATLTGNLTDSTPIEGTDSICIVP